MFSASCIDTEGAILQSDLILTVQPHLTDGLPTCLLAAEPPVQETPSGPLSVPIKERQRRGCSAWGDEP